MTKPIQEKKTVDVEELRNQATQLVSLVRQNRAEIIVTIDGEPVAILRPFSSEDAQNDRASRMKAFLVNTEPLSRDVAEKWKSELSAADAVVEQKRK